MKPATNPQIKQALAIICKAHLTQVARKGLMDMAERCGSQRLFEYNQITQFQEELMGISIVEGEVLFLCIRMFFFSFVHSEILRSRTGLGRELFLNRYFTSTAKSPPTLLARHEVGLFAEARSYLNKASAAHRSTLFNRQVLPLCQPLVESIGQRMAFEAAIQRGVDKKLIMIYELEMVKQDEGWFVEAGLKRRDIQERENQALEMVMGSFEALDEKLERLEVESYVSAPIVTRPGWEEFVETLQTFGGDERRAETKLQ